MQTFADLELSNTERFLLCTYLLIFAGSIFKLILHHNFLLKLSCYLTKGLHFKTGGKNILYI